VVDKYGVGQDPDCYAGTDTLINLLGIRDTALLEIAEREISEFHTEQLVWQPPPYDLQRLKTIHRFVFQDLYDWAGQVRTVDISKGNTRFCNVQRIAPEANKLFGQMAAENYFVGLARDQLIEKLADFYNELNVIHAFREGNGRVSRLFFQDLIVNCGYEVDWSRVSREQWIEANIAGYYCNLAPIVQVFQKCVGQPISGLV
jgi:cell filamentation protein